MRAPRKLLTATFALIAASGIAAAASPGIDPKSVLGEYVALHGIGHAAKYYPGTYPITPKPATCDAGSLPETTSTDGRVPLTDYQDGRAAKGYTCNAKVVSTFGNSGGFRVEKYVDKAGHTCAFYDSSLITGKDLQKTPPGTYVMDMSNPLKPVRTAILRSPAMLSPHESLRVNQASGLLVADMGSPLTQVGFVDVYDVKQDCRHPQIDSTLRWRCWATRAASPPTA